MGGGYGGSFCTVFLAVGFVGLFQLDALVCPLT